LMGWSSRSPACIAPPPKTIRSIFSRLMMLATPVPIYFLVRSIIMSEKSSPSFASRAISSAVKFLFIARRDSLEAARVSASTLAAFGVDGDVTNLARQTRRARPKFAVEDDGAANSLTYGDVEKIASAATGAALELAIRRRVGIVFQLEAQAGGVL